VHKTSAGVINADCLDVALNMITRGLNPLVLNMASDYQPGGGWQRGSGAQEECLFRRSSLHMALEPKKRQYYPLPELGAIYTPNAYVFRSNEETGYAFLARPVVGPNSFPFPILTVGHIISVLRA
jgi:uncharacterized protein (TIGR02452 family)